VDPVSGSDTNPGTANQPFQTVKYALTTPIVSSAANTAGSGTDGGTDVTVTIVRAGTQDVSGGDISTPSLDRGSVTVVGPSGFNLNLSGNFLTLDKGYRLQGFKIESGDPGGNAAKAAITLNAAGTPLKDMLIDCRGLDTVGSAVVGSGDRCIEVTASSATPATVTLDNVDVLITGDKNFTAGIRHVGTRTILRVINGSSVVATGPAPGNEGVVGILENSPLGSVEIEGPNTEVNLSAISPATGAANVAILLRSNSGPARKVINSKIKVKEETVGGQTVGQIGVCVGSSIDVTVQDNIFTNSSPSSPGSKSIAICKQAGGSVSPTPPDQFNTFIDFDPSKIFVTSPNCSCPS
jgi:hypothetical protein